jgi:lipopolysaccharide transport system permease protein
MAILLIAFRIMPTAAIFLLPVWIILLLMIAIGFGFFLAALTVSYRDVQYVTPVIIQLLTFATPVGYSIANPPHEVPHWARPFWHFNPLTGLLEGMRWSLLGTHIAPSLWSIGYAAIVAVIVFFGGAFAFRNMEQKFADII